MTSKKSNRRLILKAKKLVKEEPDFIKKCKEYNKSPDFIEIIGKGKGSFDRFFSK